MIPITKEEKQFLAKAFPEYKYPRTMKHDSKRHHYYCTEAEHLMRAIADTNAAAAEIVRELDKRRRPMKRNNKQGGRR